MEAQQARKGGAEPVLICPPGGLKGELMARRHEAEELLRRGTTIQRIASEMGISVASVIQYLRTRVGEGSVRFSDIYFAIPKTDRALLQRAADEFSNNVERLRFLKEHELTTEELDLC